MAIQACYYSQYSIRICDNVIKASQKPFQTINTFAEYKTEEERPPPR